MSLVGDNAQKELGNLHMLVFCINYGKYSLQ